MRTIINVVRTAITEYRFVRDEIADYGPEIARCRQYDYLEDLIEYHLVNGDNKSFLSNLFIYFFISILTA